MTYSRSRKYTTDLRCIGATVLFVFFIKIQKSGKCLSPWEIKKLIVIDHEPLIYGDLSWTLIFTLFCFKDSISPQICKSFREFSIDILGTKVGVSLKKNLFHYLNLKDNGLLIRVLHQETIIKQRFQMSDGDQQFKLSCDLFKYVFTISSDFSTLH